MTRGKSVGRHCGAAMVGMKTRLIFLGGWNKNRWNFEENTYNVRKKRLDSSISGSEINNNSLENTGLLNYADNTTMSDSMPSVELSHQAIQHSRTNQFLYLTQHQSQFQYMPLFNDCPPILKTSSQKGTYNTPKPWELLRIYLLKRNYWVHLRVKGLPEMECVAFLSNNAFQSNNLFVVGRTRDASNRITMGWIKDE
ncbi:6766_t:CDS:1 [Paraglomus occultum]|uniref:6766_t:CDS:1 n=1 Tax=Paraglomus occultum TaxID=144539 RepID=A0A9N8VK48_9GLOM|nr:6766_t:CDS:1 [Paraglomus occultum]